jgi:lantibiotic leader peptide-processing serine protease
MRRILPFLCMAALGACADSPVEVTRAPMPRLNVTGSTPATARHVVLLSRGAGRDDFAQSVSSLGGTVIARHEDAGFAVVEGLSADGAATLARSRGVQAVEPDLVAQVVEPGAFTVETGADAADAGTASASDPTTAVRFPRQWNMRAIGAPAAWAAGRLGAASVKVAILDSGTDDGHLDLAGRVDASRSASFLPTSSVAAARATGDCFNPTDHELINGRPAFSISPTKSCAALPAFFPGKPAWTDLNGHGSYTGSIVSSNAVRLAGVTSNVKLMAVKVLNARGSGSFSAILQGVAFATDNGADVINMSLGAVFLQHGGYISFLNGITRYAHSRGVTIVVAAGNEGLDLDHSGGIYEAFCSSGMVICVSATGPVIARSSLPNGPVNVDGPFFLPTPDEPAIYSNYGTSSVDVAAPGGNYAVSGNTVVSAVSLWSACSTTALDYHPAVAPPPGSPEGTPPSPPFYTKSVCTTGNTFISGAFGTSAASPHVAGLAALLVEDLGRNPGQIRTTIQQTADDLGKPGVDPRYGKGRINVPRALGL